MVTNGAKTLREDLKDNIATLETQLKAEQAKLATLVALPDEKEVATELHTSLCRWNHTDGCSWGYEGDDWTAYAHARWLDYAEKALATAEKQTILDLMIVLKQAY